MSSLKYTAAEPNLAVNSTSGTILTTRGHTAKASTPAMSVHVSVQFSGALASYGHSRIYESSPLFHAADAHCAGLVRRIEHCCEEFITRQDSHALASRTQEDQAPKPRRFQITFQIYRRRIGLWAVRMFRSYQADPLTAEDAQNAVLATDRIVGMFLKRHDGDFRWLPETPRQDALSAANQALRDAQPLACVPESAFSTCSQDWVSGPGFYIEVSVPSQSRPRQQPAFESKLQINSHQSSPLTIYDGESLFWRCCRVVNKTLNPLKRATGHSETWDWPGNPDYHQETDRLDQYIHLKVVNSLGPRFNHLQRTIGFKHAMILDAGHNGYSKFLHQIRTGLEEARDDVDAMMGERDDFIFSVVEVRGSDWLTEQPEEFRLDPALCYSRRTIEAILTRVQTGIKDVLRGSGVTIRFFAYKRGHVVLDKAIVAREKPESPREHFASPDAEMQSYLSRLRERIAHDMDMVCRDTLSLGSETSPQILARPCQIEDSDTSVVDRMVASRRELAQHMSEQRVFPLVPTKYRATSRESTASTLTSETQELAMGLEATLEAPDAHKLEISVDAHGLPHDISEDSATTGEVVTHDKRGNLPDQDRRSVEIPEILADPTPMTPLATSFSTDSGYSSGRDSLYTTPEKETDVLELGDSTTRIGGVQPNTAECGGSADTFSTPTRPRMHSVTKAEDSKAVPEPFSGPDFKSSRENHQQAFPKHGQHKRTESSLTVTDIHYRPPTAGSLGLLHTSNAPTAFGLRGALAGRSSLCAPSHAALPVTTKSRDRRLSSGSTVIRAMVANSVRGSGGFLGASSYSAMSTQKRSDNSRRSRGSGQMILPKAVMVFTGVAFVAKLWENRS